MGSSNIAKEESKKEVAEPASSNIVDIAPKQSKKELFASLDKLKAEISLCRKDLNHADSEKELWYKKTERISLEIRNKIGAVKEERSKRDELTGHVRELKGQRAKLDGDISRKISEATALRNEARDLSKILENRRFSGHRKRFASPHELNIRDPFRIKQDMEKIELKLETEDMPFEKEKELSKKLKMLKKSLEDASGLFSALGKIKALDSEISALKKSRSNIHNELKKTAEESQKLHESVIASSKLIDGLKEEEGLSFKKFADFKKDFNEANHLLKERLKEMSRISEKMNQFRLEEDEKRKLEESTMLKSKEQELEEKIKSGKKITTEDFLAFQHSARGRF